MKKDVTLIIKTFERPDDLTRMYKSIREFYPELKIIIVDDSKNAMSGTVFDENVEYIHTEFDIGLSAGRNLAVSKVKTKYLVLMDDDFIFVKNTNLEKMYAILETTKFQIIGGGFCNFGKKHIKFRGTMDIKNSKLYMQESKFRSFVDGLKRYDFCHNFFMAETAVIKANPWDDNLKLGEHEDFFLNLKQNNILITDIRDDVFIHHFPKRDGSYYKFRKRAYDFQKQAGKKHGFDEIVVVYPFAKRIKIGLLRIIAKIYWQVRSCISNIMSTKLKKQIKKVLGK